MIRPAVVDDFRAFFGEAIEQTALEIDGEVVAIGVVLRHEGRLWAALDTRAGASGLAIVKAFRETARRLGEPVFVECQSHKHATAERLLRAIGFTPTDERRNGMGVWRYG